MSKSNETERNFSKIIAFFKERGKTALAPVEQHLRIVTTTLIIKAKISMFLIKGWGWRVTFGRLQNMHKDWHFR